MTDVKLVISGVGGVGRNVTRLVSARPSYEVVAAYTRNARYASRDLGTLAGIDPLGVTVAKERGTALAAPANLLLIATSSFLQDVADDIRAGIAGGVCLITTAEEAAFPWSIDEPLADELDRLARDNGVSVIGLGLNPGFIFDALLLTASGIAWDVEGIRIQRVVDVSRFSETIQRRMGIGFTEDEFHAGVAAGSITGHIGFPQTFHLAARSMGRNIEWLDKALEPLIADRTYVNQALEVAPGTTGGFIQRYAAIASGTRWMSAEFIAHVDPQSAGYRAADSITIDGYNGIKLTIDPGCQPQLGTAGFLANAMPRVLEAPAGFLTVADLRLPHARQTHGVFT
jgi:4-hydroxy-tetrahydrodipicolinate reductase